MEEPECPSPRKRVKVDHHPPTIDDINMPFSTDAEKHQFMKSFIRNKNRYIQPELEIPTEVSRDERVERELACGIEYIVDTDSLGFTGVLKKRHVLQILLVDAIF